MYVCLLLNNLIKVCLIYCGVKLCICGTLTYNDVDAGIVVYNDVKLMWTWEY